MLINDPARRLCADFMKPEFNRLMWPIFVYSFLRTLDDGHESSARSATELFKKYKDKFEHEHSGDLHSLELLGLPEHVKDSAIAKTYMSDKYRLTLSTAAYDQLIGMLEADLRNGGVWVLNIMTTHLELKTVDRVTSNANAIDKILGRNTLDSNWPTEDEGIPGHNPGQNSGNASSTLTRLKLGPLPMEPSLFEDVLAELQEEDQRNPAIDGTPSLVSEFTGRIKQEETDDAPTRAELPYPASKIRDVQMEVLKIKELRSRFKIESQKDKLSVCMYTFHNTHDT